jgi:blue copper oxidase
MKKLFVCFLLFSSLRFQAQSLMPVPDTLSGAVIQLTMHKDSVSFFPGKITRTYAFNAFHYLGPTLILKKGFPVSLVVNNQIGDTTTVHWHGLHVASKNDGGPFSMIMAGATWNPQFTVKDKASTYWYHPHLDKKTASQAIRGAVGLIIVRDSAEAGLPLPRRYGLDDFPVIVQSMQFDALNQPMPKGMQDSTLLVNGVTKPYVSLPAQVVRLRLLNASGERTFNFGFTANKTFFLTGTDGGLLPAPVSMNRIRLSPGERAEIVLNLTGMQSQTIYLMSYASELPMGVAGGPTMYMPPPSPPMDSPINGVDFNILQINVGAQTLAPITSIPSTLVPVTRLLPSMATKNRSISMTSVDSMNMDGPFLFNGQPYNMMRIDYYIPLNSIEVWTLINKTMVGHPFHLHASQFYIVDRKGQAPSPAESGRKDVVLLLPYDTVRIITKFEDFSNDTTPYMYHCHILMHEDDGMMGQFLVVPASETGIREETNTKGITLYPNPASNTMAVHTEDFENSIEKIQVYNMLGQLQYKQVNSSVHSDMTIQVQSLPPGAFLLYIYTKRGLTVCKFIKQ